MKLKRKAKYFNVKFQASAKREIVSQSEICVLAYEKNAKVSHCSVGQLDTNFSSI